MPDIIDENGVTVKTLEQIITGLETDLKAVYGSDINLDQNSPDGQLVNIFAQEAVDLRELLVQVNNGFDPDKAVGQILSQRVVINNITRQGGTFTTQPIEIVVDRTVTLDGLDGDFNEIDGAGFTIQDDSGNQFILIDTVTLTAGTHTKNFRAKEIGSVTTTVNTINNFVTIVLGVVSVNNPSGALSIGQDEEKDPELRIRRQQSVSINSAGFLDGLRAKILNLDGVNQAKAYQNDTASTDANGIPAHGIWVVVNGGANTEIADLIYRGKNPGPPMKGAVSVVIETASESSFTAKFDRPTATNLYIRFDIQPVIAAPSIDEAGVKQYIVDNLVYNIGEYAETSQITEIARDALIETGGEGVAVNVEISDDDITYVDYLKAPTLDAQWVIDVTRITTTVLP